MGNTTVANTRDCLVARISQGDHDAFGILYKKSYDTCVKILLKYTNDYEMAEDIVSEAYIKFWHKLQLPNTYFEEGKAAHYVSTIAYRLLIDAIRKNKREQGHWDNLFHTVTQEYDIHNNEFDILEQEEKYEILMSCIEKLPEPQQDVIMLRYFEKMTYQQILDEYNSNNPEHPISINTFLARGRYGRMNLEKIYLNELQRAS